MVDGIDYTGCPHDRVDADAASWLSLYPHYKQGNLLRDGGINAQPYLYLSVMGEIGAAIAEIEDEREKEREGRARRSQNLRPR